MLPLGRSPLLVEGLPARRADDEQDDLFAGLPKLPGHSKSPKGWSDSGQRTRELGGVARQLPPAQPRGVGDSSVPPSERVTPRPQSGIAVTGQQAQGFKQPRTGALSGRLPIQRPDYDLPGEFDPAPSVVKREHLPPHAQRKYDLAAFDQSPEHSRREITKTEFPSALHHDIHTASPERAHHLLKRLWRRRHQVNPSDARGEESGVPQTYRMPGAMPGIHHKDPEVRLRAWKMLAQNAANVIGDSYGRKIGPDGRRSREPVITRLLQHKQTGAYATQTVFPNQKDHPVHKDYDVVHHFVSEAEEQPFKPTTWDYLNKLKRDRAEQLNKRADALHASGDHTGASDLRDQARMMMTDPSSRGEPRTLSAMGQARARVLQHHTAKTLGGGTQALGGAAEIRANIEARRRELARRKAENLASVRAKRGGPGETQEINIESDEFRYPPEWKKRMEILGPEHERAVTMPRVGRVASALPTVSRTIVAAARARKSQDNPKSIGEITPPHIKVKPLTAKEREQETEILPIRRPSKRTEALITRDPLLVELVTTSGVFATGLRPGSPLRSHPRDARDLPNPPRSGAVTTANVGHTANTGAWVPDRHKRKHHHRKHSKKHHLASYRSIERDFEDQPANPGGVLTHTRTAKALSESSHSVHLCAITQNRCGYGLNLPMDDHVAAYRDFRAQCPDKTSPRHEVFCERCDNSYPSSVGGADWLKRNDWRDINPLEQFPEPIIPKITPQITSYASKKKK